MLCHAHRGVANKVATHLWVWHSAWHSEYLNDLGPVAPFSVNFNHQLAYFADHSDTTHVRHQPTAVA